MANQITDNRTLVDSADVVGTVWVDISGAAAGLDTEIKVQGAGSIGEFCTTTRAGTFYRYASNQDLSNNHVYIWFNCGIVGLLDTKANGGVTFRARGPTITDYLEWELAGSDVYPTAVEGGWVMFVIDLESTPTNTGGTPPATTAIRELGLTFITASVMPRMADNCWVDEIRVLPDGSPGIIVEGRNGGATDWKWADLPPQLGVANGTAKNGPAGSILLNTPVQFFLDDGSTHAFNSINEIILWENQEFVASDLYGITVLGAAGGTANFTMGIKTGSGDDATGAQGGVIVAESSGTRWFFDADIANIDACNMYGVQMLHGGDFQIDNAQNSWISCIWLDCDGATVSNAEILRCLIVDANTVTGVAFMITDDMTGIVFCSFAFSAGHAIELNAATPTAQNNKGNLFSGYANIVDSLSAALLNSAAGALVISSSSGSNIGSDSYRNTGGGSVVINNNIAITFDQMRDDTEVRVYATGTSTELAGIENATAGSPDDRNFTASIAASTVVDYVIHSLLYETITVEGFTWPSSDATININQRLDRNYLNP